MLNFYDKMFSFHRGSRDTRRVIEYGDLDTSNEHGDF